MTHEVSKILDTSGLLCPEPLMLLHKTVREAGSGDLIKVIATDPSTTRDIPKFCNFLGHQLISQEQDGETYYYLLKKA